MVTANLWKIETNTYSIQVNKVKPKERKEIKQLFKGWKETAVGFHRDGSQLFIFSKELSENENVYSFAKLLPFPLTEEKKSGQVKEIKTRFNDTKRRKTLTKTKTCGKIKGKRSCSKCGHVGHNSRTCKK